MNNIKLDRHDIGIIKILFNLDYNQSITTYKLGCEIFGKPANKYEARKWDNFVRCRLEKLSEYGLIDIITDGKINTYMLILDNVKSINFSYKKTVKNQKSWLLKINNSWVIIPQSL